MMATEPRVQFSRYRLRPRRPQPVGRAPSVSSYGHDEDAVGSNQSLGQVSAHLLSLRGSGGRILWSYFVFALYSLPLLLGGLLLFCIGCYVVMAGLHLASAHLRWQIASAHEAGGGTLAPAKPETPLPSGN